MPRYVDGYLIRIPKKNLAAYKKMAQLGMKVYRKHGALEYRECVGQDLKLPWGVPFTRILKTKPGETVVFSWIVFKSKAHRDRVNARVMKDPAMKVPPGGMPFQMKDMAVGGFEVLTGY